MKLKLKLNASELQALNTYLYLTITGQAIEHLRQEPADYLVCSVLKEIFDRTNAKVEDIRQLPTRRTDAIYGLSVSRSEALAIACSLNVEAPSMIEDSTSLLPFQQDDTYEQGFLQALYGRIHHTFLV